MSATGNRDWLRQVLHEVLEPLLNYARPRCGDRHLAADHVQEALVAALTAWDRGFRWDDDEHLWRWLVGVVRHKVTDEYRRYRRRFPSLQSLQIDPDQLLEPVQAGASLPESQAEQSEVRDLCRFAISELAPRQQEVVQRFYQSSESHIAIARTMGITVKAVESLLARARRDLHRVLQRNLSEPEALL